MHESGIFQGNDRNECDHDDDISLDSDISGESVFAGEEFEEFQG
jgi:hypothetical protein